MDLSFGTERRGRGGEPMGGEGESGGLKKKGRPIGRAWPFLVLGLVSNRMREMTPEGNKC
jgi:hypothetical protein